MITQDKNYYYHGSHRWNKKYYDLGHVFRYLYEMARSQR